MAKTADTKQPAAEEVRGRPVGRILIKMGVLSREKVHACLKEQQKQGGGVKLGEIMLEKKMVTDDQLRMALAAQLGMVYDDIEGMEIPSDVIEKVPAQMATTNRLVPVSYDAGSNALTVALDSPDNFRATDDLSTLLGFKVKAVITDASAIDSTLAKYYSEDQDDEETINDLIDEIQSDSFLADFEGRNQSIDLDELKELLGRGVGK